MSDKKEINPYTEANGYLTLFNSKNIPTIGDGNCWFRTLSFYFDAIEDNFNIYRQEVYEQSKKTKKI